MPKIEITEIDNTSPGVLSEDLDVVYIPGFVDTTQDCLNDEGEYKGIPARVPTLFTSVASFVSSCGKRPAQFTEDQKYSVLNPAFSTVATPTDGTMFKANDYDPSYIMAKELLASGINVLYERINPDVYYQDISSELDCSGVTYSFKFTSTKEDPNTNEEKYKFQLSGYKPVALIDGKAPTFLSNTYYKAINLLDTKKSVVVLETKPKDWDTNCTQYYESFYYEKLFTSSSPSPQSMSAPKEYIGEALMYKLSNNSISIQAMYQTLGDVFNAGNRDGLVDRGNYSIKYLTSGGYPVYEYAGGSLVTKMLNLAETRGDCVAIIDHTDNTDRNTNVNRSDSLYSVVKKDSTFDGGKNSTSSFGTMFTPWAKYNRITSDMNDNDEVIKDENNISVRMSGGFAYLMALADSLKTNAPWLAVAGSARGTVRNLAENGMTTYISNGVADDMQPRSNGVAVNAITNIKPYGYTIWGNRTLRRNAENLIATSFLNVRNLVSDVKKVCYRAARKLTFEQNNDVLWVNFKAEIAPTLDRMVSGYGLSGYKLVRDTTHEKAAEKATLCAKIFLYPVYPVEDFYVTIVLQDDEVSVE